MVEQRVVKIANFEISNKHPIFLMAGPCQIESKQHAIDMAGWLVEITKRRGINYIFKASFDKANRTSINSIRGVGLEKGMETFDEIKKLYGCPVVTDIHTEEQCAEVAKHVDVLQIPAFLSRQTDLLVAAAKTGKVIHVKKGQFAAPWEMKNVIQKSIDSGNPNICITERGSSFGYNTLVTDLKGLPQMAIDTGCPLIMDCTHSVQQPGGQGTSSGGQGWLAPAMARAAIAVGVAGIFAETHDNPEKALSDGPNMIPLKDMERQIENWQKYDAITKSIQIEY
ncbi:MAG: 3-deoxy-8-phosphooctulonate synthase [Lactobacillus sp.]|jgi:2-dehydro-3-deoxyphosphooctonate aldolase (KDO 8-P synthase)|nr:3-deoxy-8-phosphooctulonate synthase [Lactobacillus sp.]